MVTIRATFIRLVLSLPVIAVSGCAAHLDVETDSLWRKDNIFAWCATPPWDQKARGPEERAEMLVRLGLKNFAYNWRPNTIPTFGQEIQALQKKNIEIIGWALYGHDNPHTRLILETFKKYNVKPDLWLTQSPKGPLIDDIPTTPEEQEKKLVEETNKVIGLVRAAEPYGVKIHLYNHNGWFGMVDNQIAIINRLKDIGITSVGMVYNFSHSRDEIHDDSNNFRDLWGRMQKHVVAVNITGVRWEGQIVYPSQGDSELEMMRVIEESGWRGHVGIIAEKGGDAEITLTNYMRGIDWLVAELRQRGGGGAPPDFDSPVRD